MSSEEGSGHDFDQFCLFLNELNLQKDEISFTNIDTRSQFRIDFMTKVLVSNQEMSVTIKIKDLTKDLD